MNRRDRTPDEGPELVPPPELLRLRRLLVRPPSDEVRAQHLAAVAVAARHRPLGGPIGRFASKGVRVAAVTVAGLAITSGLAGAQLLPGPAQRILSDVSDRFIPFDQHDPAEVVPVNPGSDEDRGDEGGEVEPTPAPSSTATAGTDVEPGTTPPPPTEQPSLSVTTTTLAGPTGPGSPTDPTDPSATTTTTVDPSTTTTTTPSTTTTTTPSTTTTTTTTTTTVPGSTTTTTATVPSR